MDVHNVALFFLHGCDQTALVSFGTGSTQLPDCCGCSLIKGPRDHASCVPLLCRQGRDQMGLWCSFAPKPVLVWVVYAILQKPVERSDLCPPPFEPGNQCFRNIRLCEPRGGGALSFLAPWTILLVFKLVAIRRLGSKSAAYSCRFSCFKCTSLKQSSTGAVDGSHVLGRTRAWFQLVN